MFEKSEKFLPHVRTKNVMEEILAGIQFASDVIGSTMGPGGLFTFYNGICSKDGATTARRLAPTFGDYKDSKDVGVRMVVEASTTMNKLIGDGTTTVAVLLGAFATTAFNLLNSGYNVAEIHDALEIFLEESLSFLKTFALTINPDDPEMKHIAFVAANGDEEIAELLYKLMKEIGKDRQRLAVVEESKTGATYLEHQTASEGEKTSFFIESGLGMFYPSFLRPAEMEKNAVIMEMCYIMLIKMLNSLSPFLQTFSQIIKSGASLLIITESIDDTVKQHLIYNRLAGTFNVVVIVVPGVGNAKAELLQDIALFTNSKIIGDNQDVDFSSLKKVNKVKITTNNTILMGCSPSEDLKSLISQLRSQIDEKGGNELTQEKLRKRLSNLTGGVYFLYVGGRTDLQLKEKKDRVEDALNACKAALDGVVTGGGLEFMKLRQYLMTKFASTNRLVYLFAKEVLTSVTKKIVENTKRMSPDVVIMAIEKSIEEMNPNYGFDGYTGKLTDLYKTGIISPVAIALKSIELSVTASLSFIKAGAVFIEEEKKSSENE